MKTKAFSPYYKNSITSVLPPVNVSRCDTSDYSVRRATSARRGMEVTLHAPTCMLGGRAGLLTDVEDGGLYVVEYADGGAPGSVGDAGTAHDG